MVSISKDAGSQPPTQEPKQSPQNQTAEAERRLREAAADYVASGNSPTLEGEMEPYAERVDYYDQGIKTQTEIRTDLAKQRQRWTSRGYQFSRIVRTQYDPAKDIGAVIVHYAYKVSNSSKRKAGDAESLIVYRSVSTDPKVILVKEHKFQ